MTCSSTHVPSTVNNPLLFFFCSLFLLLFLSFHYVCGMFVNVELYLPRRLWLAIYFRILLPSHLLSFHSTDLCIKSIDRRSRSCLFPAHSLPDHGHRVCSPLTLCLTMAIVSVPHSLFARPWPVCRCVCVALRCVAFQLRAAIWTRRTPPSSPSRHGTARQPPHNSPSPTLLLFSSNNRVLVVFCACTCVYMCVCVCMYVR